MSSDDTTDRLQTVPADERDDSGDSLRGERAPPSQSTTHRDETPDDGGKPERETTADLAAQVELLEAENRRLRSAYTNARRSRYRRTAVGLAAVGSLALAGALVFPGAREVLLALGGTGLFAAVLTRFLTPERFVAAGVADRVSETLSANVAAITSELGLTDERYYLPVDDGRGPRLFVPQHREPTMPPGEQTGPFVLDAESRGLLVASAGGTLLTEFVHSLDSNLAAEPGALVAQLTDGLVDSFELAAHADSDLDTADGRVTIAVDDPAFDELDRIDHPIPSFLAAGLAAGLDRPVALDVADAGDDEWLVTCRLDPLGRDGGTTLS